MTAALDHFLSWSFALKALRLRLIISGDRLPEDNEEFDLMVAWGLRLA